MNPKGTPANLKPWKPGQSGNPNGIGTAGSKIKTWINAMAECSREQLMEVIEDASAPAAKVIAARRLISAVRDDAVYRLDKEGNAVRTGDSSIPGTDFARLMDYTEGKPVNNVNANIDSTIRVVFADEDSVKQAHLYGTDSAEQTEDA